MNKDILNTNIQEFINNNLNANISKLLLKNIPFKPEDKRAIIEQIEAKKRSQKKLPTWFNTTNIYYPIKLNIEQTSSEITAKHKASLISGESLIDLTAGFGVDAYYFSKQVKIVWHCEINTDLSAIAKHNFKALKATNITCLNESGISFLNNSKQSFSWIYIDPSRRNNLSKKVFLLSDCEPNFETHQDLFLENSKNVMLKTSPLLDITATLVKVKYVKTIHIVAVNNEVKELLWHIEKDYNGAIKIETVNLKKALTENFSFNLEGEVLAKAIYNEPLAYLYEPNSAILKSGAFNLVSEKLNISKLQKHSHLYTSENIMNFPGRRFKIIKSLPFNKKLFVKENILKANVTTRNFPLSVANIRKKLNIKDGGDIYLFFTTNINNEKIIVICSKL